jgi:hypothetical protein
MYTTLYVLLAWHLRGGNPPARSCAQTVHHRLNPPSVAGLPVPSLCITVTTRHWFNTALCTHTCRRSWPEQLLLSSNLFVQILPGAIWLITHPRTYYSLVPIPNTTSKIRSGLAPPQAACVLIFEPVPHTLDPFSSWSPGHVLSKTL